MGFRNLLLTVSTIPLLAACAETPAAESPAIVAADPGMIVVVRDTMLPDAVDAPADVEPLLESTLSTKLMGRVVEVAVREGDHVRAGALLVRLDDRDLGARREQAQASLRSAEAALEEARLLAGRMRALFADSAAPRAQVDAAEAGLIRAEQSVRAARAGATEVESLADYFAIRAPFNGTIVQRFVDPGALAAPGSPLIRIEDASRIRLMASIAPPLASRVRRGATIEVSIEGVRTSGRVEAVLPARSASLVTVQVIVDNADGRYSSGSAATVSVPGETRMAMLVPVAALVHTGELAGVRIRSGGAVMTRWLRLGRVRGDYVEVLSGLSAGDSVVVPVSPAGA